MAVADEERWSPSLEGPAVFEIALPITVIEVSDDDFWKSEDEDWGPLGNDGYLKSQAKEDERGESDDENHLSDVLGRNSGEQLAPPIEVVKVNESDEEIPDLYENLNSIQTTLFQNIQCNSEPTENCVMGHLNKKHNGIENEQVTSQLKNDHSDYQRTVAPLERTQDKGGNHLTDGAIQIVSTVAQATEPTVNEPIQDSLLKHPCVKLEGSVDLEGTIPLVSGFNEADSGTKKSGGLQGDTFPDIKSEEDGGTIEENKQRASPVVSGACVLGDSVGCAWGLVKDASTNLDVAGHLFQTPIADHPERRDMQENLNCSSETKEHSHSLQVEHPKVASLQNNEPKNNTPPIISVKKHLKFIGTWKCLFCNMKTTSSVCLRKHLYTRHKDKKICKCNLCQRALLFSANLKHHCKFHVRIRAKKRRAGISKTRGKRGKKDKNSVKKKDCKRKESKYGKFFSKVKGEQHSSKNFFCRTCPFESQNPKHFVHHMKEHNDRRLYQCPQCEYFTGNESYMLNHLYWHAGYELYKCTFCAFFSLYFNSMVKHSYLHTGAKPYLCAVCQLGFTSSSGLSRHTTTHCEVQKGSNLPVARKEEGLSILKKYVCDKCSIVFYTRKHLEFHKKYHSQVQDCDKAFPSDWVKEFKQSEKGRVCQKTQALHSSSSEKAANFSQFRKQLTPVANQDQEDGSQEELDAHAQKNHWLSSLGWKKSEIFPGTHICDQCGLVFRKEEHLLYHKATHTPVQPRENTTCNNQASGEDDRLPVVQSSQALALKLFKCQQCAYTTNSFSNLRIHFSIHTGEKPFKCQECEKSFRTSSHLKRHSLLHLRNLNKCNLCFFIGGTVKELKLHQKTCKGEGPVRCKNSEKQIGVAERKENKNTLVLPGSYGQIYRCEHCDYATYILGNLRSHTRIHTGDRPYSCDTCQKKFRTASHLKRHKFVHQNLEFLKCDSCDYAATNWQSFKRHVASHTDGKPSLHGQLQKQASSSVKLFVCDECGYTTIRNGNLKTHLRIHTGEKPYKCSQCSLAFRTSSHLNRHLATHLKVKCNKCRFSATSKRALQKHAKTHKEKKRRKAKTVYKCTKCKLTFSTPHFLKVHQKKHKKATKK
ncbi:zinc finger protein 493-like [Tiliqua scincoides]|uniref:zinc finger protein 493-like n=1 Tax=Tiliqua scincoides TaxID=71010 RepID=UPI00346185CD